VLEKLISADRPVRYRKAAVLKRLLWTPVQRSGTEEEPMERTPKKQPGAVVEALRTRDRTLTPQEERTVRMRQGIGVPASAPLARMAQEGTELADELLLLELQLARQARARVPRMPSPAKSKIVRALKGRR
jgi:hypothetical protein